jgi:hypothetical protein
MDVLSKRYRTLDAMVESMRAQRAEANSLERQLQLSETEVNHSADLGLVSVCSGTDAGKRRALGYRSVGFIAWFTAISVTSGVKYSLSVWTSAGTRGGIFGVRCSHVASLFS